MGVLVWGVIGSGAPGRRQRPAVHRRAGTLGATPPPDPPGIPFVPGQTRGTLPTESVSVPGTAGGNAWRQFIRVRSSGSPRPSPPPRTPPTCSSSSGRSPRASPAPTLLRAGSGSSSWPAGPRPVTSTATATRTSSSWAGRPGRPALHQRRRRAHSPIRPPPGASPPPAQRHTGVAVADYDSDGWLDILVTCIARGRLQGPRREQALPEQRRRHVHRCRRHRRRPLHAPRHQRLVLRRVRRLRQGRRPRPLHRGLVRRQPPLHQQRRRHLPGPARRGLRGRCHGPHPRLFGAPVHRHQQRRRGPTSSSPPTSSPASLFINNTDGTFTDATQAGAPGSTATAWARPGRLQQRRADRLVRHQPDRPGRRRRLGQHALHEQRRRDLHRAFRRRGRQLRRLGLGRRRRRFRPRRMARPRRHQRLERVRLLRRPHPPLAQQLGTGRLHRHHHAVGHHPHRAGPGPAHLRRRQRRRPRPPHRQQRPAHHLLREHSWRARTSTPSRCSSTPGAIPTLPPDGFGVRVEVTPAGSPSTARWTAGRTTSPSPNSASTSGSAPPPPPTRSASPGRTGASPRSPISPAGRHTVSPPTTGCGPADLSGDGILDLADIQLMLGAFIR
jgi:hypothetical protein